MKKWLAAFVSGCLFALAVTPLIASLHLSTPWLILSLWLLLYVLGFLLSMIEANAFADGPSPVRVRDVVGSMAAAAVVATITACLIKPPSTGALPANIAQWIDSFGRVGLLTRLSGAVVTFMVSYCVIGSITWRFVRRYYEDPKLGLHLRIPRGWVVILLQLGRGLIAMVALTPLLASSSAVGFDRWLRFALALAVTSGVIPLMNAAGWPVRLRVIHGVEIVVFYVVYTLALWQIIGI